MTSRIMPGTDDDPGALQAGVVLYIDAKLNRFEGYAEPTYRKGPHALGYEGDTPPAPTEGRILVREDQLYRYGFQSPLTLREIYHTGVPALDRYAQTRFGALFAELPAERQDDILRVLDAVQQRTEDAAASDAAESGSSGEGEDGGEGGDANGGDEPQVSAQEMDRAEDVFGELNPGLFFTTVHTDTIEGMFSDPHYGGNRDMVGWALLGYPGSQRSYSPAEMLGGTTKAPQPMHQLSPMNPDRAAGGRSALEQDHEGHGG